MTPTASKDNYYSRKLSGNALALYEDCVDQISKNRYSITGNLDAGADPNEFSNSVSEAVIIGCPELFWVDQNVSIRVVGDRITLTFADKYPGKDHASMGRELYAEIDRICKKIRAYKTPYERIYRLNQYLSRRVEPEISTKSIYGDAYGALINRKARCEGYSKAAKLILDRLGIESIIARGEADSEGGRIAHAWNIIVCDGRPYHFDFTWNASLSVEKTPAVAYMFLSDRDILLDHYPKEAYPQCLDESKEPWNVCNAVVKYIPDISRAQPMPIGKDYVVPIRFSEPQDEGEVNEHCLEWARNELSSQNLSSTQCARYLPRLQVLLLFLMNE